MDVLRIDESSNGRRVVLTYTSRGFTNYAFVIMTGDFSSKGLHIQVKMKFSKVKQGPRFRYKSRGANLLIFTNLSLI